MLSTDLLRRLKTRCSWPTKKFATLGDSHETKDGLLVHIDRGASVLGVAHLDSIMKAPPRSFRWRKKRYVTCPQLDDRLGVWVLLDVLPALGVECDVILTDSEEVGRSTAAYFDPSRQYNWIFEFDRHGTDVVMYEYEHADYIELLANYDFDVGWGSFSDICSLDRLGVAAFNFGTGYHNEHTPGCYAELSDTISQAKGFAKFWRDLKGVFLEDKGGIWADYDYPKKDKATVTNAAWVTELAQNYGYRTVEEFREDCPEIFLDA